MKIIKKIAEYIEDELDGAEKYIKCAIMHKTDNPQLSRVFYEISMQEMHHVDMLHGEIVKMIEQHRREKGEPPAVMLAVWEYAHERHIEEAKEIKLLQSEYRTES
jgi:hypothetical protein